MIDKIAIAYGDARYGRACSNCNYLDSKTMSVECGLHCLQTKLNKCCGTWCGEKKQKPKEVQEELF